MDTPEWVPNKESECIHKWTEKLHSEAKRMMLQDGSHVSLLFLFNKENGLISVDPIPPNVDPADVNKAIVNAVNDHNLYGVVLIAETWAYFVKENDHTAFQLLDGEMRVSDLNAEDRKEALLVRMENRDGQSLIYLNQIIRDNNGVSLKDCSANKSSQTKWFV